MRQYKVKNGETETYEIFMNFSFSVFLLQMFHVKHFIGFTFDGGFVNTIFFDIIGRDGGYLISCVILTTQEYFYAFCLVLIQI